jgi:chromosome segregation protein
VVATLEADVAGFRAELSEVESQMEILSPEVEQLEADEAELASRRDATAEDSQEVSSRAASAAAEVRGELRSVRTSLDRTRTERDRMLERSTTVRSRIAELVTEIERHRAECSISSDAEGPLVTELEQAEATAGDASTRAEGASAAHREALDVVSRLRARVEALQMALDAARERAGAERLSGLDGVLGTLLDVVEIDVGWEASAEAALGEALSAVVVDSPESARRALETLRSSATSGAVLAAVGASVATPSIPEGCEPVSAHVHSDRPGVRALLGRLLTHAVRASDLDRAIEVALAQPDLVVVTEAGDRLGPGGWRIGAGGGGATAAALADAERRSAEAEAELVRREAELADSSADLDSARQRTNDVERRLDANDARFAAASEALAQAQARRRELEAEAETAERTLGELGELINSEEQRLAELESLLPALTADEEAEVEAARRQNEARSALEARVAVLGSRRRDLEVRSAGLREREEFLRRRIDETERRLEADREERAGAAERRERVERAILAVDRLAEVVAARRTSIVAERESLDAERRRQSDEVRALTAELDSHRAERTDAEQVVEQTRERLHRADVDEAEAKLRLETTVEALRRDLGIEPEVAEQAEPPEVPEGATHAGRVRELERELRLLGPINPLALEEFNELNQRHEFLEQQLEDVRSTRRELNRVIAAVDVEIQNVFAAAFADVSTNFTQLFAALFPGGTGALKLTVPDDLLNTGIEVEAKPSGKNVKKLSLLSGGERSLTALAFLFAVFRSRPSPFYVMDEVEAALDDVNLHRFLNLIQEFRRDAQLIIVSHQKRTMEAGDALLGVSMQPGGSSKVVTERVSTSTAVGSSPA